MTQHIEPVCWTSEEQIQKSQADPGHNMLIWGEPLAHHPDVALVRLSDAQAALTAAFAAMPGPAVKVKALEWEDTDEGMCTKWRAAALGGHYELAALAGDDGGLAVNFHWGRPLSFWFIQADPDERGPTGPKIFPTLDEAKDAAQADYERRILSTLSPATDLASENERLRAAIREAGLKARDEVVEGLSGDGSPDNDLADYLERIVDACANAITKEPTP